MVLSLIPDVGYVTVASSGLVTMKRKWWSLRNVQSTVTDLVIGVLPKMISEFAMSTNGPEYQRVFNEHIAALMSLRTYNPQFDTCNYVWEQYQKYCVEVPHIVINTNNELLILKKKNYLPIPLKISTKKIAAIADFIQEDDLKRRQRRFVKRLNRMVNNLPIPVIKMQGIFAFS